MKCNRATRFLKLRSEYVTNLVNAEQYLCFNICFRVHKLQLSLLNLVNFLQNSELSKNFCAVWSLDSKIVLPVNV
jgi:hypothetical protein